MPNSFPKSLSNSLNILHDSASNGILKSLEPMLPLLFRIRGKPYSLKDHFAFAPMFSVNQPERSIYLTGRQLAKSMSTAAQTLGISIMIPHLGTLVITPEFEMTRRFSKNYIGYLLGHSPVKKLIQPSSVDNNVFQRDLGNGSVLHFSFAGFDAERTRGLAVDRLVTDETQNLDLRHFPVFLETISASNYAVIQHMGTAKSPSNTIQIFFNHSSMGEWTIKCMACSHDNIASIEYDLLEMIGPVRDDISRESPATVCAKCKRTIYPRPYSQGGHGRYFHRYPERLGIFEGRHIPQVVMPIHCESVKKWRILVSKMNGIANYPFPLFLNEVCGEPSESGFRFLTEKDLIKASCLPWDNKVDEAVTHTTEYVEIVCSTDWGGGGVYKGKSNFDYQSYTTTAVCGLTPDGKIDVIFGYRSPHPHDHVFEAKVIAGMMETFHSKYLVHDYTGAGTVRESLLLQSGLHHSRVLPVVYVGNTAHGLIHPVPATEKHPRDRYQMDRNRAINYTMQYIKSGIVRFFRPESDLMVGNGLVADFLNIMEDKSSSGSGRDSYRLLKDNAGPDDFAQAVTMGVMMLYYRANKWPDLSLYEGSLDRFSTLRSESYREMTESEWEKLV